MNLSEMKQLLRDNNLQLTKSLGQNFLHDHNQLQRIVQAGSVGQGDQVLEIGPGLGPLTEELLKAGAKVYAIEMDRRLCLLLRERFRATDRFELEEGDALERVRRNEDWSEWKLVANLPYSVASPIIVELALNPRGPLLMAVTIQSEVAQRIMSCSGDDDYGLISLLVQCRYEPISHFKIPPGSFFPEPDVDSTCVVLRRRERPLVPPESLRTFVKVAKRGFSQRRKMMLKLLKADFPLPRLQEAFSALEISPQVRAEAVPLDKFVQLAVMLDEAVRGA